MVNIRADKSFVFVFLSRHTHQKNISFVSQYQGSNLQFSATSPSLVLVLYYQGPNALLCCPLSSHCAVFLHLQNALMTLRHDDANKNGSIKIEVSRELMLKDLYWCFSFTDKATEVFHIGYLL